MARNSVACGLWCPSRRIDSGEQLGAGPLLIVRREPEPKRITGSMISVSVSMKDFDRPSGRLIFLRTICFGLTSLMNVEFC